MLDAWSRKIVDRPFNYLGRKISNLGISADTITIVGFGFGLLSLWSVASGKLTQGLIFFWINRVMDGLDGGVARATRLTDRGGFLDIVCDFIIYSGFVFAFAIYDPNSMFWSLFLIFSFIGATSTFLAYATIAAKRNKKTHSRGSKSFYYLGGLSEGTETIVALSLMCFYPHFFKYIAFIFGLMCWLTTLGRSLQAWQDFKEVDMS